MSTIISLAEIISAALETRTRNDGTEFICFKDGSPTWMENVAHAAHGDMFPDDERYRLFQKAVDAIAELDDETEDDDDVRDELYSRLTDEVDTDYTSLLLWVASHSDRPCYVDDIVEESGYSDFFSALAEAQLHELEEIAYLTVQALQEIIEEEDN